MANKKPTIGVLALQGAVEPHRTHIKAAGGLFKPVKTPDHFKTIDAFILPGGESTTMLKLINRFNLWDALTEQFKQKPVWGICAGAILMAKTVTGPAQKSFNLLPIEIQRNGYGRQLQSTHETISDYTVSFIRAPIITNPGNTEIIATHNDNPVWVKFGNHMATTFHPELTNKTPSPMHQIFVDSVIENINEIR